MYYIIVAPLLTVTLTKIAYSGEQEMVVVDALKRMDSILDIQPLILIRWTQRSRKVTTIPIPNSNTKPTAAPTDRMIQIIKVLLR